MLIYPCLLWRGGATGKAFGLAISRSRVQILLEATLRNNLRQVVYTYVPLSPSVWPQQIWAENWGLCPSGEGMLGVNTNSVARAEAYLQAKFHLDPSSRLATIQQRPIHSDRQDNGPIA